MTRSTIRKEAARPRHDRGNGAFTVQMITPDTGARDIINGFTNIPPGAGIPRHFHNCEESVLVVSGSGTVEIDGESFAVTATDVIWVPAGVVHRFCNDTGTEPLRIFWTYASVEATRTLAETGEERRIVMEHG
jgi:quercetin dioxygenase-like cupin family protein